MPQFPGSAGTKRVCFSIGSDNDNVSTGFTDILQRVPICLPVNTTRWRLKFQNPASANVLNITNVYLCAPALNSSGQFVGNVTSPVQVLSSAPTVPGSGNSSYTSPWVTSPSLQFAADKTQVLSYGMTFAAGTAITLATSPSPCFYGAGSAAQVATNSPTGSSFTRETGFADVQLEFEFAGSNLTALIVGDSLSAGFNDWAETSPQYFSRIPSPSFSTWPGLASLKWRYNVINASVAGKTYADFASLSSSFLARFDFVNCPPDVAILACGSNEAHNLRTLSQFTSDVATQVANMQSLGCSRIFICTIMPRRESKSGFIANGAASGVSSLLTTSAYANGDVVDINYENSSLNERLTVSGASTGNGPYTTTFTSNTTKSHDTTSTIWTQYESRRRDLNQFIRSLPSGCDGVLDFARAVAAYGNDGMIANELGGQASIHPGPLAYQRLADLAQIHVS